MYPQNMPEEELKNTIAHDFFKGFETAQILGKIDFCVSYRAKTLFQAIHFLWAEAKRGNKSDIVESFVQLILTIGKERTFENELPPLFLGAFDCTKIAFIPYYEIMDIFSQNDFNWNVAPSDHSTKEFQQLYAKSKDILESKKLQFDFEHDSKELHAFINENFTLENEHVHRIQIGKENFIHIYYKWLEIVAPTISVDWEQEKPDILSADFFLADVLSENNHIQEIKQSLRILLQSDYYKAKLEKRTMSHSFNFTEFHFNDNQKAHTQFWNLYERPPKEEYWDYLIERCDRLVPVDIRERKGAFFTPQIWVQKAQEYLFKALGKNYDEEYYIWDCAAGTGNLLYGLTIDKYRIYASTLDKADVKIMQDLYGDKTLASGNIFQFDFLNDCLLDKPCNQHKERIDSTCKICRESKVPKALQKILQNEEKRKRLIIFINPPYAEATSGKTPAGTGENKSGVSIENAIYEKYKVSMGKASNELFAQFFFRIYNEIPDCILASFSKLKYLNSSNFIKFRETFKAKFKKGFMIPAYTFDNVQGQFPIGFLIWDLSQKVKFRFIKLDVFDMKDSFVKKKKFYSRLNKHRSLNQWIKQYDNKQIKELAFMGNPAPDFQHNSQLYISQKQGIEHFNFFKFCTMNLIIAYIYFAVRHCIKTTWINDRDQFLMPNKEWAKDKEFQNDCLAFMLFHGQNRMTSKEGINHFIPFSETEVGAKEAFESDFMVRFMSGKIKQVSTCHSKALAKESHKSSKRDVSLTMQHDIKEQNGFDEESFYVENLIPTEPLNFSEEAKAVFAAGLKLWQYYHSQDFHDSRNPYNPNASLYDIKAHFQGVSASGRMNPPQKAKDSHYKDLIGNLNYELENLAKKIEAKVYEYEFLLD